MLVLSVALCWFFGGTERVTKFLTATSGKGLGVIEWIGVIIGAALGFASGVFLWVSIMKKTGWISESEIIKFLGKE